MQNMPKERKNALTLILTAWGQDNNWLDRENRGGKEDDALRGEEPKKKAHGNQNHRRPVTRGGRKPPKKNTQNSPKKIGPGGKVGPEKGMQNVKQRARGNTGKKNRPRQRWLLRRTEYEPTKPRKGEAGVRTKTLRGNLSSAIKNGKSKHG